MNEQLEDGQDGSDEPTTREVSEDDDDDQAVVFKQGVHAAPQVDEEFEKELAALNLSESRQPVDTRVRHPSTLCTSGSHTYTALYTVCNMPHELYN